LPDDLNRMIFRVAYACNLTYRGLYAQAKAVAAPALDTLDKYPKLEEYSTAPILRFIHALATYVEAKTPANAEVARHWLALSKEAMVSVSAKDAVEKLIPIAAKFGIETP
jgi:hypothetical protein